jgi:hypothetical protein
VRWTVVGLLLAASAVVGQLIGRSGQERPAVPIPVPLDTTR